MPESNAARTLKIFRRRPDGEWEDFANPLSGIAATDSVLFRHEKYFWIAYTDGDIGKRDNLNLLYASSLKGPWNSHANNPVRLDPRNSRSGGTPFTHQGQLYRPAQNCSATYGGSIQIMRVTECTPTTYCEEKAACIKPAPGMNPDGLHTLSALDKNRCLVDGKRMVFLPRVLAERIRNRVKKCLPGHNHG